MKTWDNFIPGWHQATNSRKFHWFNDQDKPICNTHIKGFQTEFIEPYEYCHGKTPDSINKWNGGCPKCIAALKKQGAIPHKT